MHEDGRSNLDAFIKRVNRLGYIALVRLTDAASCGVPQRTTLPVLPVDALVVGP